MPLPVVSLRDYCLEPVQSSPYVWMAIRRSDGARRFFTVDQFADWWMSPSPR